MCHASGIVFGAIQLPKEEITGKDVIEVGSYDVNGSLQPLLKSYKPKKFIGVDIEEGPGVDTIATAEELDTKFKPGSFDVVISTETMEHVRDWKKVISNLKYLCKEGGSILVTTRSKGFFYHPFPFDFWRYEVEDMKKIFSDCKILALQSDPQEPGVFIKVQKPNNFKENNLREMKLHSVITNTKIKQVTDKDFKSAHFRRLTVKEKLKNFILNSGKTVFNKV